MLEHLSSTFRIVTKKGPELDELERLEKALGPLDAELLEFLREAGVAEFAGSHGRYFRLWDPLDIRKSTLSYRLETWDPPAIAIGDDGGDHILVQTSAGLFRADGGALAPDNLHFLASSLSAFLSAPERLWQF